MRIAIATQYFTPIQVGGAEASVRLLCNALKSRGHDVHVLTVRYGDLAPSEDLGGARIHRLTAHNVYNYSHDTPRATMSKALWHGIDMWNPSVFVQTRQCLQQIRPDILHTNTIAGLSCSVWSAAAACAVPVLHTLRDYYLLCPKASMFRGGLNCVKQCRGCRLITWTRRHATRHVKGVVGNSEFILKKHTDAGLFKSACFRGVIRNISSEKPSMGARGEAPSQGPLRVGFLGRLIPEKGLEKLLVAAEQIRSEGVQIYVAGGGEASYESQLKQKWGSGNVFFMGRVDPPKFFEKIDVLVVPSEWHDPLPRVIFEAYSQGVPVIVTNRGGSPEIVDHNVTGWIYDPSQDNALKEILTRLCNDRSLLQAVHRRVAEKSDMFSAEAIVSKYEAAYESAI